MTPQEWLSTPSGHRWQTRRHGRHGHSYGLALTLLGETFGMFELKDQEDYAGVPMTWRPGDNAEPPERV
jgi:hypothetical protein